MKTTKVNFFFIKEVNHLKATISTQKVTHEQEFQEQKSRLQLEEMQKIKDIEDKLRNVQKSKEDVESRYNYQNATILDLQQKNYSSTLEVETLKRNIDSLRAVRGVFGVCFFYLIRMSDLNF